MGSIKKNKKIALDIDAFGVEWQKQVDKEIEELEGIRKMRQFDLNLEMNRLIRLLGGKEIGKIFPGRSNF